MTRILVFSWLILQTITGLAQQRFGHEWIQPTQTYLKITTEKTGIYRVEYELVKSSNAALASTDPRDWQLIHRGAEIAIHVVGGEDGQFNEADYLEFYGEANDGAQDSLLYRPRQRLHPYQSLFSDKTAYFLTYRPGTPGKRMASLDLPAQGLTPEPFHLEETVQAFTTEYTFNNLKGFEPFLQQSYYEPGEGWSGRAFPVDSVRVVRFSMPSPAPVTLPVRLTGLLNGRDNNGHRVQVVTDVAPPPPTLTFSGFASQGFQTSIDPAAIKNQQLTVRFVPEKTGFANSVSLTFVKLSFAQQLNMANQPAKVFRLPPAARQTALLSVSNVPANTLAYDLTDTRNIRLLRIKSVDNQSVIVTDKAASGQTLLLTNQVLRPEAVQPVGFSARPPAATNYVIVTHASLRSSATAYARYRASAAGGGYQTLVVEADSLYDQFNFGEKSPVALRRFADYLLQHTAATYLLLVGQANSYPYTTKTTPTDLVPTVGYPGSDILLTAGLNNSSPNTPALATGRINATTNEQVLMYLDKVQQQEGVTPNGFWRKRLLHISGGKSAGEAASLRAALSGVGAIFSNGLLGGQVTALSKNSSEEVEKINIAPQVNQGLGLITFFGHAGPSITDMNFGFASAPENGFQNQQYPLMIFNGCGVGEIFSRFKTLSTDWLLAPRKGAVLMLAHTYWSFEQPTTRYLNQLYTELFTNPATLGMPFGRIQQRLNQTLDRADISPYDVSMLLQMLLQGDPALVQYPLPAPDYAFNKTGIYLEAKVRGSSLSTTDSVRVVLPLTNLGRLASGEQLPAQLKLTTNGVVSTNTLTINSFRYLDTLTYLIPKNEGLQQVAVQLDPTGTLTELSKTNNSALLTTNWKQVQGSSFPPNLLPDRLKPIISVLLDGSLRENNALVGLAPQLAVYVLDENPLSQVDTLAAEVFLADCATCLPRRLSATGFSVATVAANQLKLTTNLNLEPGRTYKLLIFGRDAAGNRTESPYEVLLKTAVGIEGVAVNVYPNPASSYAKIELTLPGLPLPAEARLTIYSATGLPIFGAMMPISVGKNQVIWQGNIPGLYPYTVSLAFSDGRIEVHRGKITWLP